MSAPSVSDIPAHERIIVALDVPRASDALKLADALGDAAGFYKVGLELFAAGEARRVIDELRGRGKRVFADLKLYDVPETTARAVRQVAESGACFLTVHAEQGVMDAAVANAGARLKILAVTALTSMDEAGLRQFGYAGNVEEFVLARAAAARAAGCAGVICSGREVAMLRANLGDASGQGDAGDRFLLVTPGIRPASGEGASAADQKRIATPAAVIKAGGDHLVVGRPIRDAADARAAMLRLSAEINAPH